MVPWSIYHCKMRDDSLEEGDYDNSDTAGNNFKVVVRVRPPLPRELNGDKRFQNIFRIADDKRITVSENLSALDDPRAEDLSSGNFSTYTFTFDHVYSEDSNQADVYNNTARDAVLSSLQGYNASIIAYGQTGTGKTYTMEGEQAPKLRGIIPRATEEIFDFIENAVSERKKFLVRASYLQIYNEVISDLLKPERTSLQIREDKRRGVFVEGLSEWVVRSPKEVSGLMQRGAMTRATANTKMNEISSRSHAVFIIIAEQLEYLDEDSGNGEDRRGQTFKVGKLNLVDLAGSERVRLTGATGRRLEESKKINQSLSALGNVIAALTDSKGRQHIPYRDSKLTRILEDSLGGNCRTTMMAMISPALESFPESLSTLKFANRAKNIKNQAMVNEDLDQRGLLRKYELEIRKLRNALESKSKEIIDKRKILQLEELRRRAEADKVAALSALEERSREFMREKQEKRKLELRLHNMSSQLLIGGGEKSMEKDVENTVAFRTALRNEHERIHSEYVKKLEDLERERQVLEEDKSQVDRYKQLLIKQRDIMIALTSRLNERDDTIMRLQEELDAYDRHQRDLEDELDRKTAGLIHLQRIAMEQAGSSETKAKIMQVLSEFEYGRDSPETSDGNVFSASDDRTSHAWTEEGRNEQRSAPMDEIPPALQAKIDRIIQEEIEERIDNLRREHEQMNGTGADAKLQEQAKSLQEANDRLSHHCRSLEARIREMEARDVSGTSKSLGTSTREAELLREQQELRSQHLKFKQEVTVRISQKNKVIKDLEEELAALKQQPSSGTPLLPRCTPHLSSSSSNPLLLVLLCLLSYHHSLFCSLLKRTIYSRLKFAVEKCLQRRAAIKNGDGEGLFSNQSSWL